MAKEDKAVKTEEVKIESGRIKSRVKYDVTIKYDGRDCIIAPRQIMEIPDFSKLGTYDPKEIVRLKV